MVKESIFTSGTCSLSAWEDAASVVTFLTVRPTKKPAGLLDKGTKALDLEGRVRGTLNALLNMTDES